MIQAKPSRQRYSLVAIACSTALFSMLVPPAAFAGSAKSPQAVEAAPATVGAPMNLLIGKSTLLRLPSPIERISVGNPLVADVTLVSPRELYVLGKAVGATNVILWGRDGQTTILDVTVNIDGALLQERMRQLLPGEPGIQVSTAADSVVLSGTVSSSTKAEAAFSIADAYVRNINRALVLPVTAGDGETKPGTTIQVSQSGGLGGAGRVAAAGARVVNMLNVASPQQVMLEVKVAEVNKTLLDKLGGQVNMSRTNGSWTYSIISDFLTESPGLAGAAKSPNKLVAIDAEKRDGLIKVLAEPNIVALSGQDASFLSGGKIFIPVARSNPVNGLVTITLEEKEFGVGLKFTPTVLEGGRINLRVAPEVSELAQAGSPFTTFNGVTAVLPSFTTRRAQTTVELMDGQSLAIAGLIKNNVTETIKRFPVLGELPILGALFRSSEFQADKTELMFVITPRLVKPLAANYGLPTDAFTPPTRTEFFLGGQLEHSPSESADQSGSAALAAPASGPAAAARTPGPTPAAAASAPTAAPPARGGFEIK